MTKNLKISFNFLLGILLPLFGLWLIWQYWKAYPMYGWSLVSGNAFSESLSFIILPFLMVLGLVYSFLLWQRKTLTVVKGLGLLWLSIVALFMFIGLVQPINVWGSLSVVGALFNILGTVGFVLLGVVVFTLFLILMGQVVEALLPKGHHKISILAKIGAWINHNKNVDEVGMNYFLNFFMGFLVLSFFGFFMAKFGVFTWWIFGSLLVGIIVFQWEQVKTLLYKIFIQKIKLNHWQLLTVAIVMTVSVLNFIQSFFPFSIGWDSHNHYLLTINTLMESGVLRTGIFPPFTEIILGIFGVFSGLSGVQFLIVFWGSLLPLTFYWVGRRFGIAEKLNLALALALFCIPAIQFQLSKDLKMDVIYLQLLLVVLAYISTKRGLLLLGFAPLLKLTALWFLPIAVMVTIYQWLFKNIKVLLVSLVLLLLPFSLWTGTNLISHGTIPKTMGQWQNIILKGDASSPHFNIPQTLSFKPYWVASAEPVGSSSEVVSDEEPSSQAPLKSTAFEEEVGRYAGFETNFFKKLWAIFTSPNIPSQSKQYVNLGFLWMFFLPVLILVLVYSWKVDRSKFVLSLSALTFLLAWVFVAEGVAWYGLPFIALLWLLSGWLIANEKLIKKSVQNVVLVFVLFAVLFGLWDRLVHVLKNPIFTAMSWSMDTSKANQERLSKVFYTEELQVADILNKDPSANIIRIGTMTKFWVHDSDARMIEDAQLDIWSRLVSGRGHKSIIQVLKNNKVQYILIDRNTVSIETNGQGTLHKKFTDLQSFINTASAEGLVETLFYGKRIILLKVK